MVTLNGIRNGTVRSYHFKGTMSKFDICKHYGVGACAKPEKGHRPCGACGWDKY